MHKLSGNNCKVWIDVVAVTCQSITLIYTRSEQQRAISDRLLVASPRRSVKNNLSSISGIKLIAVKLVASCASFSYLISMRRNSKYP